MADMSNIADGWEYNQKMSEAMDKSVNQKKRRYISTGFLTGYIEGTRADPNYKGDSHGQSKGDSR